MKKHLEKTRTRTASLILLILVLALSGCFNSKDKNKNNNKSQDDSLTEEQPAISEDAITEEPLQIIADKPTTDIESARFLAQATFGPTMDSIEQLQETGYSAWLDAQMNPEVTQPTFIVDYIEGLKDNGVDLMSVEAHRLRRDYWLWQSVIAEDQLRMRVAFALSQIMVVSQQAFNSDEIIILRLADYYDTLARGAFGNFRDLLRDVALHPAMGEYLDHARNEKANPDRNTFPDQNFARELLQLFTIGLTQLNPDHSSKLDANGKTIATYDSDIVGEFARVFTGWTFAGNESASFFHRHERRSHAPMRCYPEFHDDQPKVLFDGAVVSAGNDPALAG